MNNNEPKRDLVVPCLMWNQKVCPNQENVESHTRPDFATSLVTHLRNQIDSPHAWQKCLSHENEQSKNLMLLVAY